MVNLAFGIISKLYCKILTKSDKEDEQKITQADMFFSMSVLKYSQKLSVAECLVSITAELYYVVMPHACSAACFFIILIKILKIGKFKKKIPLRTQLKFYNLHPARHSFTCKIPPNSDVKRDNHLVHHI